MVSWQEMRKKEICKVTVIMLHRTNIQHEIYKNNYALDNIDHFCYPTLTLTSLLSIDRQLDVTSQ